MSLTCTHCGKRLSRKTARQIDGVVMCGNCKFRPFASGMSADTAETPSAAQGKARQPGAGTADAQPSPEPSHD